MQNKLLCGISGEKAKVTVGVTWEQSLLSPSIQISASDTRCMGCCTCPSPGCELLENCILLAVVSLLRQAPAGAQKIFVEG